MKKVYLTGINILIFGLLALGSGGCGGSQACGNIENTGRTTLLLCSNDCPFDAPEAFTMEQTGCNIALKEFDGLTDFQGTIGETGNMTWEPLSQLNESGEIVETFSCQGSLIIDVADGGGFFFAGIQTCTGDNGTTCTVSMSEILTDCP